MTHPEEDRPRLLRRPRHLRHPQLAERHLRREVVAFCADLGQGEELEPVEAQGAGRRRQQGLHRRPARGVRARLRLPDAARQRRLRRHVYLLGTSIARPLIAKRQIEIAAPEGADAVAHGATGKGNDQVRFELTYYALEPGIQVIAPWRIWDLNSRTQADRLRRAASGIPIPVTTREAVQHGPQPAAHQLRGRHPRGSLARAVRGHVPAHRVAGEGAGQAGVRRDRLRGRQPGARSTARRCRRRRCWRGSTSIGGRHGIGRVDLVENRYVGMKSRGVYETPGGTILHAAHRAVESLTLDREVMHLRDSLDPALRRDGLLRLLVRARARRCCRPPSTSRSARSPAPRASSSTRATSSSPAASRRTRSTTPTSPPSRTTPCTARPTPKASSASTRCACASAPWWRRPS